MIRSLLPRRSDCVRAALIVAVALCGYMGGFSPQTRSVGVSPAEARQFYTRKRVNGRWITGTFPKQYARLRRSYARLDPEPKLAMAPVPPGREVEADLRSSSQALGPADTTAAISPALDAVGAEKPADERLVRLRDALQARANEIVTASVEPTRQAPVPGVMAAPPDLSVPIPPPAEVVVPSPPAGSATVAPVPPTTKSANPLEPRSVSFDFETGVKTTVFENSVVREPFDVASVKRMAAPAR